MAGFRITKPYTLPKEAVREAAEELAESLSKEHGLRSREFLLLVNEVMSAQRFDPGDETLQQRAIDQTHYEVSIAFPIKE